MFKFILAIFLFCIFTNCKFNSKDKIEETQFANKQTNANFTTVTLAISKVKPFAVQVLATGKVAALTQAKINFKIVGTVQKIWVSNSTTVKEGQILAILDNEQQRIVLQQAINQLEDAEVELHRLLIEFGGKDRDTNSVSTRILVNIKAKSGFNKALTNVRDARLKLDNTILKAPYTGVVANLKTKAYNASPTVEPFCSIISRKNMVVEVAILESELGIITLGQIAKVTSLAYPDKNYIGKVSEINPVVNEQGLVLIKVSILNPDYYLLDGMNAQVIIEKNIINQIVIPKDAVVERSGKKVVFVYENGLAKWNYVTVTNENSQEVAISNGLKAGDKVIVEGNLNLGHDAKVILKNTAKYK